MGIHQVVGDAVPGDATTEAALGLQPLLARIAPSEMFAARVDPALAGVVRPFSEYRAHPDRGGDPLIVHQRAVEDEDVLPFLVDGAEPLVLVYQGVAGAEAVAGYDLNRAYRLARQRSGLTLIRDRVTLALADSTAAAEQLAALGYGNVVVVRLPIELEPLVAAPPHAPTRHHMETQIEGPLLLFVGHGVPEERLELLIGAYHVLITYLVPEAHLAVLLSDPPSDYRQAISECIWVLNLDRSWIAQESGPPLAEYYRAASLFVSASEHAALSIPALQAMAFGLPVVARACGGLPETLDGTGLLLPADAGPMLMAEGWAAALGDAGLRRSLTAGARARLAALDSRAAEATLLRHLAAAVG